MRGLYLAWKWSGGTLDPYRMFHALDEDYCPLDIPDAAPRPPASRRRLRNVLLAFAGIAEEEQAAQLQARLGVE